MLKFNQQIRITRFCNFKDCSRSYPLYLITTHLLTKYFFGNSTKYYLVIKNDLVLKKMHLNMIVNIYVS